MNKHLYLLHGHAEEPFGFDDLKAFIHHRRRVNGDLSSHIPVGMLECIGGCDSTHPIEREGTEGSATGRKQNFLYLTAIFANDRLKDSTMFAIDRQDRRMVLLCQFADDLTGYDEGLFVGECNCLSGFNGFDGRMQTSVSYHGCHDNIDGRHSDHLSDSIRACPNFAVKRRDSFFEPLIERFIGDADHFGFELERLFDQFINALMRTKGIDAVTVGICTHDIERLRTD